MRRLALICGMLLASSCGGSSSHSPSPTPVEKVVYTDNGTNNQVQISDAAGPLHVWSELHYVKSGVRCDGGPSQGCVAFSIDLGVDKLDEQFGVAYVGCGFSDDGLTLIHGVGGTEGACGTLEMRSETTQSVSRILAMDMHPFFIVIAAYSGRQGMTKYQLH